MFARQSTLQGKPEQIDTGIRNFNEQIHPAVRQLKGYAGAQFLADRKSGKVVVITFWETEQALRDSEAKANELRRTAAAQVQATGEPLVERFEVVVMTEIKQPARV
jgi:heme-degrading monooxygenase HmoA